MNGLERRREFALWLSRATGNWNAVMSGDVRAMAKRVARLVVGRWTGKQMRRYLN